MRLLIIILTAAVVGGGVGAVWGYLDVPPNAPLEDVGLEIVADDEATALPQFHVDEAEYNFGKMQRGTSRSHTFVISNRGNAPLRLEMGQPSCKCTVGAPEKNVLEPGESMPLEVSWKAQADEGPFRQWVPFTTNDPRSSRIELTIVGEITQPTGLVPQEFNFGKLPVGESRTSHVFLMAYLQDSVTISKAVVADDPNQERFEVKVETLPAEELPDKSAAAGVRISVTAKEGLPLGRFTQWLDLETNIPEVDKLTVPIVGQVVGDISIAGRGWSDELGVLRLNRVISEKGAVADLNIIVRGEQAADIEFEVSKVEPPELVATLGDPKRYKDTLYHVPLKIEIPPGTRPMLHLNPNLHEPARVTLTTTHPQAPELVLDIRFAVEK